MDKKNFFEIDKGSLQIKRTPISNNYTHVIADYNNIAFDDMELNGKYIGILPFEIDEKSKNISNVFLSKQHNFFKDEIKRTLILDQFNDDTDDSQLDVVYRFFESKLAIPLREDKLEKIFYLGDIDMNTLLVGQIPCYAIDVSKMLTDKENLFKISETIPQTVERVDYNNMLKGITHDNLAMSATFLLLSYLS